MNERPAGWHARKRQELAHKLTSITREFADWRQRTESDPAFVGHHSQVARTTCQLEAVASKLAAVVDAAHLDTDAADIEQRILGIHRVWDFFRRKLLLREARWFRPFLRTADQVAWECYRRVLAAVPPAAHPQAEPSAVKEPPLVFLNGAGFPFMVGRGVTYQAEPVPRSPISDDDLLEILKALPIPVVGLPWSSLTHVPDVVAVAHEVGHVVEEDFGLAPLLAEAVRQAVADENRQTAWLSWAGEIFADLFAVTALGPAFVGLLGDTLASSTDVATERVCAPRWGAYPTAWLRMRCVAVALRMAGCPVQECTTAWMTAYPVHAMPTAFDTDIDRIVSALMSTKLLPFGNRELTAVIQPPLEDAPAVCDALLNRRMPPTDDARAIVAGARLAFERDAALYASCQVHQRAVDHIETRWALLATKRASLAPGGNEAAGDLVSRKILGKWMG